MTTGKVEKRQAAIVRADGLTIEGYLEKQVAKCSASGFLLKKLTTTVNSSDTGTAKTSGSMSLSGVPVPSEGTPKKALQIPSGFDTF